MSRAVERSFSVNTCVRIATLFLHYVRFNFAAGMEYRASFLFQVLGMALNNTAFIIFWMILFNRIVTDINGYGFNDIMFLWALAAVGYGIAAVFFGNSFYISKIIYNGELDVYLLQPKPVVVNLLLSRMVLSGWGDIAYGVVLFALSQPINPQSIVLFGVFSLLMAIILIALRIFYHSLTFFLGNAEEFATTASDLIIGFMLYPGSIFQSPATLVLHSLIPAALAAWIPIEIFRDFDVAKLAVLIAADCLILMIALGTFRLGLRCYESGNRMGTRV
jgi:ABC-2 type transport system permease protein